MNANPSSGYKDKDLYHSILIEYQQFMENYQVDGQKSSIGTRSPLQLALMISPLYLLMTWWLFSKSFHRRTLLDVTSKLGPNKPPLLLEVEKCIWDAVFRLAEGKTSPYTALSGLASSLPWSRINEALNLGTEQWFHLTPGMLPLLF